MKDETQWKEFDAMQHLPTVLVTPLGTSPGTLFSVLRHSAAAQVVVLTSREGMARIAEVQRAIGFRDEITVVQVDDPFRCFDAAPIVTRCREAITIAAPYRLVVNVTGGTTALQLAAQAVYREYRGPKKMVAVVDPRTVAEQREEPYRVGEVFVIEEK
jgi:hypothetical protein